MLRSFLAGRHPRPLLSRHHECRPLARLGGRPDAIPSLSPFRGYTSSEDETTDTDADRAEAPASANSYVRASPTHRRQHLYLVLDDWKKGFSIHKLDLLGDESNGRDLALRPPVHRQSSDQTNYWSFATLGSNIIATGNLRNYCKEDGVTLVYDTETAGLSILRDLPRTLQAHWLHAVATQNKLYTFGSNWTENPRGYEGCMHRLEDSHPATDMHAHRQGTGDHWSWSSIPSPLPFNIIRVQSIGVHPEGGGRRLFVSVAGDGNSNPFVHNGPSCTYSYDIESGEWTFHGEWDLPFFGHVHYDSELDAWVGLHKAEEYLGRSPDGYICSCDVMSPTERPAQPAWKLCTERLFDSHMSQDLDMNRHVQTSLVYIGDNVYCLVEVMPQERFKRRRCTTTGNKHMIRLSTFRLKYGKNGELTTTAHGPNRSYLFSKYDEYFQVHAFWL